MLPRKFRLPSKEIIAVLKKGKRQSFKFFSLSSLSSLSSCPEVAVIVSNKIDNRSTTRNKIKRRLKEAIQKSASWRTDKFQNKKIIFFAKKEILSAKFSEISDEINKIVL